MIGDGNSDAWHVAGVVTADVMLYICVCGHGRRALKKQGAGSDAGSVEAVLATASVGEADVLKGTLVPANSGEGYELHDGNGRIKFILHRQYRCVSVLRCDRAQ